MRIAGLKWSDQKAFWICLTLSVLIHGSWRLWISSAQANPSAPSLKSQSTAILFDRPRTVAELIEHSPFDPRLYAAGDMPEREPRLAVAPDHSGPWIRTASASGHRVRDVVRPPPWMQMLIGASESSYPKSALQPSILLPPDPVMDPHGDADGARNRIVILDAALYTRLLAVDYTNHPSPVPFDLRAILEYDPWGRPSFRSLDSISPLDSATWNALAYIAPALPRQPAWASQIMQVRIVYPEPQ